MATLTDEENDEWLIAGRSVAEWDKRWVHVPDGFRVLQSDLRGETGLLAGRQGDKIMLIAAAVQTVAGLRAGLARGRLKDQTGNTNYGMKGLRALGDTVEAYVIKMKPATRDDINELKWALIDLHQPPCNAPRDIVTAARKADLARRSRG